MLLKTLKSHLPYVLFIIPLVGFLLWMPQFISFFKNASIGVDFHQTTTYRLLFSVFASNNFAASIFAFVLLLAEAFIMVRLNFKYIFLENKTYLPAILFLMTASVFAPCQGLTPAMIAGFFLFLTFDRILAIDKERNQVKRYFEGGFFLGLGVLFYPQAVLFIVFIWVSQIVLRTFYWREWLISVIGLTLPLLFGISIAYWFNQQVDFIESLLSAFTIHLDYPEFSKYQFVSLGVLGFILFVSMLVLLQVAGARKINTRKYYSLFSWFIILSIAIAFLLPFTGRELVYFTAMPSAVIFSMFFTELRSKWFAETFFMLFVLSILATIYL